MGATGGLPGANAAPETEELPDIELQEVASPQDGPSAPFDPAAGTDADTAVDQATVDVQEVDAGQRELDEQA